MVSFSYNKELEGKMFEKKRVLFVFSLLNSLLVVTEAIELKVDPRIKEGTSSVIPCEVGNITDDVKFLSYNDNNRGGCLGPADEDTIPDECTDYFVASLVVIVLVIVFEIILTIFFLREQKKDALRKILVIHSIILITVALTIMIITIDRSCKPLTNQGFAIVVVVLSGIGLLLGIVNTVLLSCKSKCCENSCTSNIYSNGVVVTKTTDGVYTITVGT